MTWLLLLFSFGCKDGDSSSDDQTDDDDDDDDDDVIEVDCEGLDTVTLPEPRGEAMGAFVGTGLAWFGGDAGVPAQCLPQADFSSELWAWYPECGAFALLDDGGGPSARGRGASVYDPERNWLIIHGGRFRVGSSGTYTLFDDTWAYDFDESEWIELPTGGGKRTNHTAIVHDGMFIIYGGNNSTNGLQFGPLGTAFALDLETEEWTQLTTTGEGPGARLFHGATVVDDTMYVFSGGDANAFQGPFLRDMYALDLTDLSWERVWDGSGGGPLGQIWPNLFAYDGQLIMWAGHDDGALGNQNQVWSWDLDEGSWTELQAGDIHDKPANGFCDFPADFVDPDLDAPERRSADVAGIDFGGNIHSFGGKTDCGIINDAWRWNYADNSWSELSTATSGEICQRNAQSCSSLCF